MLYLASYDIAEQDADEYQQLWDYSDSLGSAKLLYSQYAVPFTETRLSLLPRFKPISKRQTDYWFARFSTATQQRPGST